MTGDRTPKAGAPVLGADKSAAGKRPALGRGLSALLPGAPQTPAARGLLTVPVGEVQPDRVQPRRYWNQSAISELAQSIRARGIIQPILVRRLPEGAGYRIVAGERRWRAAQEAGLGEVPVIVKEISETEAFELALIENIQREDLNPIEEAEAYHRLLTEHGLTQEELAGRVGKERSTIANALRLLKLPTAVREHVAGGILSQGHAKVLLGVDDGETMSTLAQQVTSKGLSVRETERLVQRHKAGGAPPAKERETPPQELAHLARRLERLLGLPCEVKMKGPEQGELVVRFATLGQADELLQSLVGELDRTPDAPRPDAPRPKEEA